MKNILKCALLIALILALTGCYPTGKRTPNSDTNINDIMSEAEKIENLSLSLTLPETYPLELPKITTTVMRWDKETVYGALGGGKPIFSEEEYPSDAYHDEKYTVLMLDENNSSIVFEPERVRYIAPLEGTFSHHLFLSYYNQYYVNPYVSYARELEGFSKEDSVQRVIEVAEKLGITNLGEPTVVGMTLESANDFFLNEKQKDEYFGNTPDDITWTKDDEAYFITFSFMYEGIPRETNTVYVPEYSYENRSFVKAIVTKDEIIELDCRGITSPEYKTGDTVKINFSAKDILSKIVSDYSQMKLADKVEFYNCELTYAPIEKLDNNEWVLAPVWRFDYCVYRELYNEYYDELFDELPWAASREYVIYNAETGNKITNDY